MSKADEVQQAFKAAQAKRTKGYQLTPEESEKAFRIAWVNRTVRVTFLRGGSEYTITGEVIRVHFLDTETGEPVVIYCPEGGTGESWARLSQVTEIGGEA